MLWSKTDMKFLCCNWHYSKRISFLKSVTSWNITLLYGLQSLSETISYMDYFQGPLLLLAVVTFGCGRNFSPLVFQIELDTFNWRDKLGRVSWIPTSSSPQAIWRITMTRKGWFPFTSCRHDKAALIARNRNTHSCLQAGSWWAAEKDFLSRPPRVKKSCASNTNKFVSQPQGKKTKFLHISWQCFGKCLAPKHHCSFVSL